MVEPLQSEEAKQQKEHIFWGPQLVHVGLKQELSG